jgi:serine/threonine protein kinase
MTPASDVYSLGIILYEMLTGTTPFSGSSALAIAMKHSSETPRLPREFVSSIPAPLEEVVLHALEKRPGDRPQDAGAFRRELYATAERLGLEHASGHSAPTIESLRGAGTETPSGRLIVDMVRVREHRASITSGEALRSADIAKEIPEPASPTPERASDTESNASPATAALLVPRAQTFSKLRIVFERPEVWLRWLRNPVALTCISLAVLMLVVIVFAIVATRSSGKSNTSANNSTEAGNAAPAGDKQLSAVPSPGADPSPGTEPQAVNNRAQQSPRNNAPRRRSVNTTQRRQPQQQKGNGFWNKFKRKINPF